MKRYRIFKIKRGNFGVVAIDPAGVLTVVGGFRRKTDAQMWIVEETMRWAHDAGVDN